MLVTFLVLFIGLELKHFIADYLLQPAWILVGKGNLRHPGGYAHAGLHAALSGVVLLVAGAPPAVLAGLVAAEFVLHYVLDFSKIHYSRGVEAGSNPRGFWALHGVDQLAHQLTYGAMIYVVLISRGIA
jgi:hypothetical protein